MEIQLRMNLPEISISGHAYLDELESHPYPYSEVAYDDERMEKWEEEKTIYGFDSTETWNLNYTFYAWLYEHLRMYQDKSSKIVDLHYHKFEWKEKEYYQDEIIEIILDHIRFFFSEEYDEFEAKDNLYIYEIGELWALILPAMWW